VVYKCVFVSFKTVVLSPDYDIFIVFFTVTK